MLPTPEMLHVASHDAGAATRRGSEKIEALIQANCIWAVALMDDTENLSEATKGRFHFNRMTQTTKK